MATPSKKCYFCRAETYGYIIVGKRELRLCETHRDDLRNKLNDEY